MKLGLFGGGFKPFTTGHFAKLARAIADNDKVYLFYGLQERKPPKISKRTGMPLKSQQKFRPIGDSGKFYTPELSKKIFDIYETAIEREYPGVEIESTPGSTPMRRIFEVVEEFVKNPDMYDLVTIYGDGDTLRQYIRQERYLGDLLRQGKVRLGSISPDSYDDYRDEERFLDMVERSEESSREALGSYYPNMSPEDVKRLQQVRGTEVRDFASLSTGIDEAKRFLPPFLNDNEKQQIIDLLQTGVEPLTESHLRYFIRGIIRG